MHVFYDFVVNLLYDYFVSSLTLSVTANLQYIHESGHFEILIPISFNLKLHYNYLYRSAWVFVESLLGGACVIRAVCGTVLPLLFLPQF